jgi:predicted hydrocarbon binding protein
MPETQVEPGYYPYPYTLYVPTIMSSAVAVSNQHRQELGDFSSIVCFKAVVVGIEEALGDKAALIALIAAGRSRGKQVAAELGLSGKHMSFEETTKILNGALGKEGTRLCIIDKIEQVGEDILASCSETICSSGESEGSPRILSYTMGAIQGVLEEITGKRLRGKQVESVLRGGTHDVVKFEVLA